ncbi:MAG: hypothetical protein GX597_02025 [Anaerolineaceae bacterium]|jgi:hypothetical protein|nr:hypothetical protein [Anaerolineae bacterium]MDX9833159.1 hypothetical protein [Anaerolineae bacterium]NLF10545.1 hypothetical protein [Anaerolineaceae bacterium]
MGAVSSEGGAKGWRWRAVVLSLAAGVVHILVSPIYFAQWVGYGVFFITVAALQGIGGMALVGGSPRRFFYWAGVVGNAGVVLLWVITRTLGIPFFGPAAGEVQPVGLPDLVATLIEVALIGHLLVLLTRFGELEQQALLE